MRRLLLGGGDGFDRLALTGLLVGCRGSPLVEAGAHFGFKCRPGGGKQTVLGFHEGEVAGILFVSGRAKRWSSSRARVAAT